ncbi:Beta-glucosidase cel3A [Cladobotryum mycophilum]|uniref:beta-glucosidase n=1 Tax=Cladobotryum mycophilum TaxID=491253 RepID=A0ABR0SHA4_9HYPO
MQYKALMALTMASAPLVRADPWGDAYTKAKASLSKLNLQQKVGIVSGIGWQKGPCVGNTSPASSIGYPSLCLQDGPLGVRFANGNTAFTPGIQAASTWDLDLIRQRGQFIAEEVKGMGVHVSLGPVGGPLGKLAQGGRNWEGFGPDPYLTGLAMAETIEAMQDVGVQATAKHWILNEQEHRRESISSNIDDRTIHELYAWPYVDAVHANVAAVMCSYNKINGNWACENEYVMDEILKGHLGFPGYIMSDWNAQHTTTQSANTGLDMTMPGTDFSGNNVLWGPQLVNAVNNRSVNSTRVDDMVTRILAAWYLTGQDKGGYPSVNFNRNVQGNHKDNVRAVARDGIVLLKNDNKVLPLKKPASIAIIGSAAVKGQHANNGCDDRGCNAGALGMGWGSGSVNYPYFVAPYDAINTRATSAGTKVTLSNSDDGNAGANAARGKDVAVVFITADSGEGYITVENNAGDRNNLDPWHNGNDLVKAVAGASSNVIVVVHSVGPIVLESILSNPSVKAVVWAGLPSQENGNALVDILYGDTNPNGKLPYTIAKNANDYGTRVQSGDDNFAEGLFIDYRHFDDANIQPRYEFGFGLSYTNYTYSNIQISSNARSGPANGPIVAGGPSDLFDTVATVTVNVQNSGGVAGAEDTPKQLRGFDKLKLSAGQSATATFNLRKRDLTYWDTKSKKWVVPSGTFKVSVGASSRDIRLTGTINVA